MDTGRRALKAVKKQKKGQSHSILVCGILKVSELWPKSLQIFSRQKEKISLSRNRNMDQPVIYPLKFHFFHWKITFIKKKSKYSHLSPDWCGSVGRASACRAKGHWVRCQGTCQGHRLGPSQGATDWCFPPSPSPSLPLSLNLNKQNRNRLKTVQADSWDG